MYGHNLKPVGTCRILVPCHIFVAKRIPSKDRSSQTDDEDDVSHISDALANTGRVHMVGP